MELYILITSRRNSEKVQNELFKRGIFWRGGQRHPIYDPDGQCLIVQSGCIMYSGMSHDTVLEIYPHLDPISWRDFLYLEERSEGVVYVYDRDLLLPSSNIFINTALL